MFDAVLTYHTNAAACGVAKFNHQLARALAVPCDRLCFGFRYRHPLTSVKSAELGPQWLDRIPAHGDLLLHDRPIDTPSERRIFYADEVGCPSLVEGDASRGAFRVLVFGMSHKILLPHFEQLKQELDRDHPDYTIELSTAVHEGHPWDEALAGSTAAMRSIFGKRLRVLGFLADDALARMLTEVDAVAAFYTPGLRANNTSAWAAVAAGKRLFTNRDQHSPTVPPTWSDVVNVLTSAESIVSTTPVVCQETLPESLDDYTMPPAPQVSALPNHGP